MTKRRRRAPVEGKVLNTAAEAWAYLEESGLEPRGRDADLVALLKAALAPTASSLQSALASASLDDFVRAFFVVAAPYVDMLKGILTLFERAKAKIGPRQWKLAFDGYLEDVEAFKDWLRLIESVTMTWECPSLSWSDAWRLFGALRDVDDISEVIKASLSEQPDPRVHRIEGWLREYGQGRLVPLPAAVAPASGVPWLEDVWHCMVRMQRVLNRFGGRQGARGYGESVRWRTTVGDAFADDSACQIDSDYWLRSMMIAFAVISQGEHALAEAEAAVGAVLRDVARATYVADVRVESLKEFTSLPLWKRRHEFFAAWVAAEMVEAVSDHDVQVHGEDGTITFPFRETRVASVTSSYPAKYLISERRTSLLAPVGKGRAGGVQPDFGWWQMAPIERCELVVEVKHYKTPARRAWADVFADYARAHESARVLLVNYGPPGAAAATIPENIRERCEIIGDLRPGNDAMRQRFAEEVRKAVGERVPAWPPSDDATPATGGPIVVLDVSSSMNCAPPTLRVLLGNLAATYGARWLAGVDTEIVGKWPMGDSGFDALLAGGWTGGTQLAAPVAALLESHSSVILVTDDGGRATLANRDGPEELVDFRSQSLRVFLIDEPPN